MGMGNRIQESDKMSNRRKDKLIDDYVHDRLAIKVDIYLTPDNEFKAEYAGANFQEASIEELKKKLKMYLEEIVEINFVPIIEISFNEHRWPGERPTMDLQIDRYYVAAVGKNDGYRQLDWRYRDCDDKLSYATRLYGYDFSQNGGLEELPIHADGKHYLHYADELWAALKQLQDVINTASDRIAELIGSDEGIKRLDQVGQQLLKALPAGTEKDAK
jgi:hypothetical protein